MLDIPATPVTPINTAPEVLPMNKPVTKQKSKALTVFIQFISIFSIFLTIAAVLLFFSVYVPVSRLYSQATNLKKDIEPLKVAISNKDLKDVKVQLSNLRVKTTALEKTFNSLAYFKALPYLNNYYADGHRLFKVSQDTFDTADIFIKAIEPYQDFLGLKGAATDGAKTTEDRITFLTQSVEGLLPYLDSIDKKITDIDNTINEIDISRYPSEYKGIAIHQNFNQGKTMLSEVRKLISNGKPILNKTSWLLGKDAPRKYLIVFQNDGELRPSGGFWTAYATIKMDKGKVVPGSASNIYDLDDKLASTTPAPRILKAYHINVPYLNLRDSNLSPDFPTDAQIFLEDYYKVMGKKDIFDAVIALDTNVLVDMVKVLGKLDTRVGTFTTAPDKRCDGCPQIIYELEWISGRPRNYIEKNRKDFLAPLMQALLANSMGSEKTKIPLIGQAFFNNVFQKHIMFYFPNTEMQSAAQLINIAGQITPTDQNVDYFHLNDANFAGAKSNFFIRQKIKHEIIVKDGKVEHKVAITYTNPSPGSNCNLEKGDLCLNAPAYRNMFRFYVSPGSQLVKLTGSEVETVTYDELGKKVFEGFFGNKYPLYAMSSSKTSIDYISSVPASKNYSLLLQKQPGTKPIEYEIWLNGQKQEAFSWVGDKTIKLSL